MFIDLVYCRKLKLETFFANDHCLEDVSLGVCAINISNIGDGTDMKKFIKDCACVTNNRPLDRLCEICSEIREYKRFCEICMRVHSEKK